MSIFLNKNGVYNEIFHLLWSKNEIRVENQMKIDVPDTIFFEENQPVFWYFSNSSGKILKKNRETVTIAEITKKFEEIHKENHKENTKKSEVLAYFISAIAIEGNEWEIRYFDYNGLS